MKRTGCSQTKRTSILTLALFSFILISHAQWTEQTSGVTSFLTGVHFTDTTYGWVSGTAGTILHTTNAGAW